MARSRWKLKYFSRSVWRKIIGLKKNKKLKRRGFYDRSSTIPECFFSYIIRIHKGRKVRKLVIDNLNVGKKFGKFSFTKKPFYFPPKRSKKKKNVFLRK